MRPGILRRAILTQQRAAAAIIGAVQMRPEPARRLLQSRSDCRTNGDPLTNTPEDTALEAARQHFLQGVAHFEAGRFIEAQARFEAALELAPGRASVLFNLGATHFRLGQMHEALPLLAQATAADPAQADAWTHLGLVQVALAQWRGAVDAMQRALALTPQNAALWLLCGRAQLRLGDADAAMRAYDRALAIAPGLGEAWSERGSLLRELGRNDEAARCFEQAIALGFETELNAYYLASVRGQGAPAAPPRRYVEALFDDYAADFEAHLTDQLRYSAHASLLRPLLQQGGRHRIVLDLGCGTGLCGTLIRPLADAVDGVDVSRAMLEKTRQLGVYRDLTHADLVSFVSETGRSYDLVLAADVFIYVGELAAVFKSVRRILARGGSFALTVELPPAGQDFCLLPSLRYAHSKNYIQNLAKASGFVIAHAFEAPLRYDQQRPVQGLYVYLN